ncbi:unnamed protein product [Heligmosomoides polygyrus]|uniref:DUF1618 domain-containing protein n=1 Tax=Heligmosomoides polygyrus TaxID=6339 RepID=A0A183F647_HELPZ|nr:unnamed protein product [Heligmosomoides polygyrus]
MRMARPKFRIEDEWDVIDPMNFPLSTCQCSQQLVVRDLLVNVPQPAAHERIECVLDAARVLAVWWGPGSIALKGQRIVDRNYLALSTKAMGVAYAFFKARMAVGCDACGGIRLRDRTSAGMGLRRSHVGVAYAFFKARMAVGCDACGGIRLRDRTSAGMGLRRSHANYGRRTQQSDRYRTGVLDASEALPLWSKNMFYYRSFFDLRRKNTKLFADEVGRVVLALPPKEPEDPYSWITFVGAVDLWMSCGAHVWLVNGPRSTED